VSELHKTHSAYEHCQFNTHPCPPAAGTSVPAQATPAEVSLVHKSKASQPSLASIQGRRIGRSQRIGRDCRTVRRLCHPAGHRVRTGINVLRIGASNPSAATLEDVLLHRFVFEAAICGVARKECPVRWWTNGCSPARLQHQGSKGKPSLSVMREQDHALAEQQQSLIQSSALPRYSLMNRSFRVLFITQAEKMCPHVCLRG